MAMAGTLGPAFERCQDDENRTAPMPWARLRRHRWAPFSRAPRLVITSTRRRAQRVVTTMSCAPKLPEILSAAPPERSARRVRLALEYVAVVGGIVAYLEISAVF